MVLVIVKTPNGYYTTSGTTSGTTDLKLKNKVTDKSILEYIKKLAIPPAYTHVKINYCKKGMPKILYMGIDTKGRLQRIYSPVHNKKVSKQKLCDLYYLSRKMSDINHKINETIRQTKLTQNKCICLALKMMICCYFRLGNMKYYRLYGSTGTISIKKKHIKINKEGIMTINFKGKKGVVNNCIINNKSYVCEVKKLIKDKQSEDFVFSYLDHGIRRNIKAIDVNYWLQKFDRHITTKMFRTYNSNIFFLDYVKSYNNPKKLDKSIRNKVVISAVKNISEKIHNTPKVLKRSYLDTSLIEMYINEPAKFSKLFFENNNTIRTNFENYILKQCKI